MEKVNKIHKTIRYDSDNLEILAKVSKMARIPRDQLVNDAVRRYVPVLKRKYPDYEYVPLKNGGKDER